MRRRFAAAALLLAAAGASAERVDRAPAFTKRVNDSIDRGVLWLRKRRAAGGTFDEFPTYPGATTALAYVALRCCGVPKDDPDARAAWDAAHRVCRHLQLPTYTAAVCLMAIAERGDRLPDAPPERDVKIAGEDRGWATELVRSLSRSQTKDGSWSYSLADAAGKDSDLSNMQYALLGLKAAARCGIDVDDGVWRRALEHLLDTQQKDGRGTPRAAHAADGSAADIPIDRARGWEYVAPPPGSTGWVTAAMTAGGVSSLVVCRSELLAAEKLAPEFDQKSERAVWDGLAWLGTNWTAVKAGEDLYEAYGVERAGVLSGVARPADLDWYGVGAEALVAAQLPDGSWSGRASGLTPGLPAARAEAWRVIDTCFALMFLKRGTAPVRLGAVTGALDDTDINFGAASSLRENDFSDFVELVLSRWRRATDDGVKARLFDGATSAGPRLVEPLLLRMDALDAGKRAAAGALLVRATGEDFGFAAEAAPAAREQALDKWRLWWLSVKDKLAYDPLTKRLAVQAK